MRHLILNTKSENFFCLGVLFLLLSLGACKKETSGGPERSPETDVRTNPYEAKPAKLDGVFVRPPGFLATGLVDGKTWGTAYQADTAVAFQNAAELAANANKPLILAAGDYDNLDIELEAEHSNLTIEVYRVSDTHFRKGSEKIPDDSWASFSKSPIRIHNGAKNISFTGGILFQDNDGAISALIIEGADAANRIENISVKDCRFENNQITGNQGGGIRIKYGKNINLTNVDATNNKSKAQGGFLRAKHVIGLNILGGKWVENKAQDSGDPDSGGGALWAGDVTDALIRPESAYGNEAKKNGGVIKLSDVKNSVVTGTYGKEGQDRNYSEENGGAIFISGNSKNLRIEDIDLENNAAEFGYGGAIYVEDVEDLSIKINKVVANNEALHFEGGAIYGFKVKNFTLSGGKFEKNKAIDGGGAVYISKGKNIHILDTKFVGNRTKDADSWGGAFACNQCGSNADDNDKMLRVERVIFDGNTTQGYGGAVSLDEPDTYFLAEFSDVEFLGNKSEKNGGAFFARKFGNDNNVVSFERTKFTKNQAAYFGGALALDARANNESHFSFEAQTFFTENESAQEDGGGAIFLAVVDNIVDNSGAVGDPPHAAAPHNFQRLRFNNTFATQINGNASGNEQGKFIRIAPFDVGETGDFSSSPLADTGAVKIGGVIDRAKTRKTLIHLGKTGFSPSTGQELIYVWK